MRFGRSSLATVAAVVFLCSLPWIAAAQPDDEAAAWSAIPASQSADDFKGFIETFPKGKFVKDARLKYSQLTQTTLPPRTLQFEVRYPSDAAALPFSVGSRSVVLDILVQADGKAGAVKVTKPSGFDPMDRAAVGAARRAVYLPAVENGVAVSAHMPMTVGYRLICPGEASL